MPSNPAQPEATQCGLHKTTNKPVGRNRRRSRQRRKAAAKTKLVRFGPGWPQRPSDISENVCKQAATDSTVHGQPQLGSTRATKSTAMWESAFASAIRWQTVYRTEFWKHLAARRQQENQRLRQRLRQMRAQLVVETAPAAAESGMQGQGGEEDNTDEVDEQYLQFVEVSMRHQMQLKRERELEECQSE